MQTEAVGGRGRGRILAVDYGRRRVGLAVSDPLGLTAQGLETLQVRSQGEAVREVERVAGTQEAREIVVGLPLNMDGSTGPMAQEAEAFASDLARRTGVPVRLWDERLTSSGAHRALQEMGVRVRGKKGAVDRMAAVMMLQGYLESLRSRDESGDR